MLIKLTKKELAEYRENEEDNDHDANREMLAKKSGIKKFINASMKCKKLVKNFEANYSKIEMIRSFLHNSLKVENYR